jgi:hypothetical protein
MNQTRAADRTKRQNAMNLRNVTIWTTGMLLLLTVVTATISFFHDLPKDDLDRFIVLTIKALPICLMCSGCPLFGSWVIAIILKHNKSIFILFVPTIVYGVLYVSAAFLIFNLETDILLKRTSMLLQVGFLSIPVMIPIWILAIVVELRHRGENKQKPESLEEQS